MREKHLVALPCLLLAAALGAGCATSSALRDESRRLESKIASVRTELVSVQRSLERQTGEIGRLLEELRTDLEALAREQESLQTDVRASVAVMEGTVDEIAERVGELRLLFLRLRSE